MKMLNIAGYKFIKLDLLTEMQQSLKDCCARLGIKGTILLSEEGININLSGLPTAMAEFKQTLQKDARIAGIQFHEFESEAQPFRFLKVKIKKEIITMRQPQVKAAEKRAPSIAPKEFKRWLDEKRDITILDTRNDFEVEYGTFDGAVNLHLNNFGEFPKAIENIDKQKPIVMFCTGGVRCEKAALYMLDQGYSEVYQLDGGILGYFTQVGSAHYTGSCFVFDNREKVTAN